jgi:polar amino acid transport system substrate-binding protein
LLLAAAWADDLDRLLETRVVRVAVPQDLPPFGSIAEGAPRGYDVDVARRRSKFAVTHNAFVRWH